MKLKPRRVGRCTFSIGRLEDPKRVDEWRKEMGMGTVAKYAEEVSKLYGSKVAIKQ